MTISIKTVANAGRIAGLLCALGLAMGARAGQGYPDHAVKLIVPYSVGGSIDILGRAVGQQLTLFWNTPIVVENRPGASGDIGIDLVARSAPDGYTYLMAANTITMTPNIRRVPYDPVKDFTAVAPIAVGRLALVARPDLPVKTLGALIAYAKAHPGKLSYGTPGNGTPHHLAMEQLKQKAGIDLFHVPYKASGSMVSDVLGGQIDVAFVPVNQALQHYRSGKLLMLASGGTQRVSITPEVPSLAEASGIADVDCDLWFGLYVPKLTPQPVVDKIRDGVNAALKTQSLKDALLPLGLDPTGGSGDALEKMTSSDLARWKAVVQKSNIRDE